LLLSSLSRALPVSSGVPTSADFNAIWNTAEGGKPSGSPWSTWAGTGDELRIKKINLEPLFYRLVLIDHDAANPAYYSIDSTGINTVPAGGLGLNSYYFDGTIVGLHNPSGIDQTKYMLKRDISFVFEAGNWSGAIVGGQSINPLADFFAAKGAIFYASVNSPGAQSGGSTFSALVAMYSFMFDYTLWANECPHFDTHGTSSSPEATLLYEIGGQSHSLDVFSGASGLIK